MESPNLVNFRRYCTSVLSSNVVYCGGMLIDPRKRFAVIFIDDFTKNEKGAVVMIQWLNSRNF